MLVSLILTCFSPLFPPQHPSLFPNAILARTNNRLDTSKKAACCWPTWKWPRSAGEGRELWKPAAGPRAKVWSPVDWQPSSPEERVFYGRAKRGACTPHHRHHPSEDDRCSVRSLQQEESIRHLYNGLRMREKRGGGGEERKGSQKENRLWGCMFALDWDIGHRQSICVLVASSVCKDRDRKTERGKWENRVAEEEGEEREVGSWHRCDWLSLNRTSFHTHYTCPLQSAHRTGTGAYTSDWWKYQYFMVMWCSLAKTTNVFQNLSATELFQGFNIRAYPHNRARVGMWSKGLLGRKDPNFRTASRKNFPSFCVKCKLIQRDG